MTSTTSTDAGQVTLREVEPGDVEAFARICFEAFGAIHDHHRFPRDFPALEAAAGSDEHAGFLIPRSGESSQRSTGGSSDRTSSTSATRSAGVGPITVDPRDRTRASAAG